MRFSEFIGLRLLFDAVAAISANGAALFRAAAIPAVVIVAISTISTYATLSAAARILAFTLSIPAYVLFATSCHRIILLGDSSLPNPAGIYWTSREIRFLGLVIGLLLLYLSSSFIFGIPIALFTAILPDDLARGVAWSLTFFVATYFQARFSLVLPSTAIDRPMHFPQSWSLSYGNGLRITVALVLPVAALQLVEYGIFGLTHQAIPPIVDVTWQLLVFPIVALDVAVITVAYSTLAGPGDGPNAT